MRTHWLGVAIASALVALGLAACGSDASNGSGGGTTVTIWEGYTQTEAKAFAHLVSEYNKQHPGTTVSSLFVNNDNSLQKVLTAVRGGSPPDIAWHWEALLWEAGGQIRKPGNKQAAFDSPAGLQALTTLRDMAVTDHSMYLDPSDQAYTNLFNSGKIGMLVTGPWDLSVFPDVQYGVQVMPSFPGAAGGHQTISGPDNWVIFNNGATHTAAAEKFLLWLTAPAQVKYFSLATGDLPIRRSVETAPGFLHQMDKALPGVDMFITNLG